MLCRVFRRDAAQAQQAVADQVDDVDHREQRPLQQCVDIGRRQANALRIQCGERLRSGFAEDQYDEGQRERRDRHTAVAAEPQADDGGHRGGQFDRQHIAEQDQADQSVGSLEQRLRQSSAALALLGAMFEPIAVHRHQAGFGTGEERGQRNQHKQQAKQRRCRDLVQNGSRFVERRPITTEAERVVSSAAPGHASTVRLVQIGREQQLATEIGDDQRQIA